MFRKTRGQTLRQGSGQSTVEYILLATAVIAAMVLFTKNGGVLQTKLGNTLNTSANSITDMGNRLQNSEGPSGGGVTPPQTSIKVKPGDGFNNF